MTVMSGNHIVPTSTVAQARVRMWQPTQRPTMRTGEWIETAWGHCRVTGRAGQRHADLLEAFLWCSERRRQLDDGGIELLVDPSRVRQTLSDGRHSLERIKAWITELRSVSIEIETPRFSVIGGIIDHVELSPMTRINPLMAGGKRNLWRVRINKAFAYLLENDLALYYNPAPVARLKRGVSQAIARHILTHKTQPPAGWHLDGLIVTVGGAEENDQSGLRNRRREVRLDATGLYELGIVVDGDRVWKYTKKMEACSTGPRACSTGLRACSTGPRACSTGPDLSGYSGVSGGNPPEGIPHRFKR